MSSVGFNRDRAKRQQQNGLVFYPKAHRYKLDGEWVPGVTTILGVLEKPAIPKWAAKLVAEHVVDNRDALDDMLTQFGRAGTVAALKEVPWKKRDDAGVRGTDVHSFAERIVNGEEVDVPEHYVGHVESALAFMEDWHIQPVLVEAVVGSRAHQYAGTLDLVARHHNGPRGIFDYKTAASGIYMQTAFQNAAYAFAEFHGDSGNEKPMADLGVTESYGVHLRADGYDVHQLAFGPEVYDEFLCIRRAYEINKRANGDWKVPGSGYVSAALAHEVTA
jgi:hypothetical protein